MRAAALRTILAGVLAIASATGLQSCTETSAADAELLPAESAQVIAVVDGDTIDVQTAGGEARVRLIGLDTPEINRDGGQDDCYAQEARDELNAMVYGQAVELRADPTQDDTDRYGRLLRHVYSSESSRHPIEPHSACCSKQEPRTSTPTMRPTSARPSTATQSAQRRPTRWECGGAAPDNLPKP